jgi:hypothetical protein
MNNKGFDGQSENWRNFSKHQVFELLVSLNCSKADALTNMLTKMILFKLDSEMHEQQWF